MKSLPIDAHLTAIKQQLVPGSNLVLVADPGAGKTTRVPPSLLGTSSKQVWVLEPRRLAARLSAERVAHEQGLKLGTDVGYQTRDDSQTQRDTPLRFVTEGIFLQHLKSNPKAAGIGTVLFDEVHERHLDGDIALAVCRQLQRTLRPDISLCAMSATLDAQTMTAFLDAPLLHVQNPPHPLALEYMPTALTLQNLHTLTQELNKTIALALTSLLNRPPGEISNILVFLPGQREISACKEALELKFPALEFFELYGTQSKDEQQRTLNTQTSKQKVILSTNVAETSLTLEGVNAVIDSGLKRSVRFSESLQMGRLALQPISQSSAIQRAGRAARTRPGHVIRLYSKYDFEGRAKHDAPEVQTQDLSPTLLWLSGFWDGPLARFPYFEAPSTSLMESGISFLKTLGAFDAKDGLTDIGNAMLQAPVHPRISRLLVEGKAIQNTELACLLAALLEHEDASTEADLGTILHSSIRKLPRGVERGFKRLGGSRVPEHIHHPDVVRLLLCAHTDRLAKKRPKSNLYQLHGGKEAQVRSNKRARETKTESEFLLALSVEQIHGTVFIDQYLEIEEDDVLEHLGDAFVEEHKPYLQEDTGIFFSKVQTKIGSIVLDEQLKRIPKGPLLGQAWLGWIKQKGWHTVGEKETLHQLLLRIQKAMGNAELVSNDLEHLLLDCCSSIERLDDLHAFPWTQVITSQLSHELQQKLSQQFATHIQLPGRANVPIHHDGAHPWIESRIQDFFGLSDTPTLAGEPLLLHLLAPNYRAVQVTKDLAGFWDNHYPSIKKELMRQYPRHAWPENPRIKPPPRPPRQR